MDPRGGIFNLDPGHNREKRARPRDRDTALSEDYAHRRILKILDGDIVGVLARNEAFFLGVSCAGWIIRRDTERTYKVIKLGTSA